MRVRLWHILFIIFIIAILHISSILFDWYDAAVVWVDNVEHILAGIALSTLFVLVRSNKYKNNYVFAIYIILFVFAIAVLWELIEFCLLTFLPDFAQQFSLYSPTLLEALEDIISNLIGSIIFILINRDK